MVDLGTSTKVKLPENNDVIKANHALVAMLVCLNGHFKTPIGYYMIKSLSGEARSNLVNELLMTLHENGISDVRAITFDGASTNITMVQLLGAKVNTVDEDCFFDHPSTNEPIVVVPDGCHMLKNIRNCLAEFQLIDKNNKYIDWRYIVKLVEYQEKEGIHPATKITRRCVEFQNEKMKVKLAATVFSASVASALTYMENKFDDFKGCEATSIFCKNINDCFDIVNSNVKLIGNKSKECFTKENVEELEQRVAHLSNYISSLKIVQNDIIMSVLQCRRKTGFWGIIIAMKSCVKLAKYVFNYNLMSYLLTYKMSQDHLETFFSSIRKQGGFNNNPTCLQFRSSYKKIVCHVNSTISHEGNCIKQDDTAILRISGKESKKEVLKDEVEVIMDHDYTWTGGWIWTDYRSDIVAYMPGFVVKSIKNKIKCSFCLDSLESDCTDCELIKIKNRFDSSMLVVEKDRKQVEIKRGLTFPSKDVITVCKIAETVLRTYPNIISQKNILNILPIYAKRLLSNVKVFENVDEMVEKNILYSHRMELIDNILKKYFTIRLHHECNLLKDKVQRIRSYHHRLILFKNQ